MTAPEPAGFSEAVEAAARAWPTESVRVDEWHPDDARLHRQDGWKSFEERNSAVLAQRQERVAEAVVAAAYPVIAAAVLDGLAEWVLSPERNLLISERQIVGACARSYFRQALSGGTTTDTGENQ